jgi:hypothetical protein
MYKAITDLIKGKSLIEFDADTIMQTSLDDFVLLMNRDLLDPTFKLTRFEANNTVVGRAITNTTINTSELTQVGLLDDVKFSL